ncbi:hypothetical protein GCM10008101_13400 [Lysobacter xinjiangensis]|uniref:Uncharacterized protein n=2 Tax=Cognatilysobacter xinjiangensis TaxID=546892 RepID=A0ABQ3BXQ3_9GAMM|nr:hypothetical protein GCM10008101_13400 [Lysobacter xinjiangensis]
MMSTSELSRVKERSKSRKKLNEIYEDAINSYLIHYSCESFYAPPGHAPVGGSTRVTCIVVRNLKSAQTKTWSIHKSAELLGQLAALNEIVPSFPQGYSHGPGGATHLNVAPSVLAATLDPLELDMLEGYFAFLSRNTDSNFIHWNMRDDNYGFSALEHRYRVLGGQPTILPDSRKFDLARELVTIYGKRYASHTSESGRKGRLMSVIEMNKISDADALQGAEEADAFVKGEYRRLQQSTWRKVDVLANIFDRVHEKSLKTRAGFIDKYGIHPIALVEVARNNPIVTGLIFVGAVGAAVMNYGKVWLGLTG